MRLEVAMKTILLGGALLALWVSPAFAASGTVQGTLRFYNNQGNYCPASRDCTGAKYLESQYQTNRPVRNVKVYARRSSDNQIIGEGTTNANGFFSFSWNDPSTSGDVQGQIIWRGEHKDNRYRIATSGGGLWIWWANKTFFNGQTTNAGTMTWGNSSSPHALSNLYAGAEMMWANSLGQSNRMNSHFSGVQIRAWTDNGGDCPTSCASGPQNRIYMDSSGTAYMPQGRVMHEMGHIASYRASRSQEFTYGGDTLYDGVQGWSLTSPEWAAVHFEEGVSTHLADVALYFQNATQPHTCITSIACPTNFRNIETSLGTSCGTDEHRQAINAIRYFWDNYDSVNDPGWNDALSMGMWHVIDTIHAFDNGTNNRQKDEPWNSTYTSIVDKDGRSCIDFRENWKTWGTDSSVQLANNCGSAGD